MSSMIPHNMDPEGTTDPDPEISHRISIEKNTFHAVVFMLHQFSGKYGQHLKTLIDLNFS